MSNRDSVDNTPLREAVAKRIREGETLSGICRTLGGPYMRSDRPGAADTTQLTRRLGMVPVSGGERNGRRYKAASKTLRYDVAVRICQAIDGDPVELGL